MLQNCNIYDILYRIMRKKKNTFLETKQDKKHFDAFNVISVLLFFAVLVTFIVCLVDYSIVFANATDKNVHIYPLVLRILAIVGTFVPMFLEYVLKIRVTFTVSTCYYLVLFLGVFMGTFNGLFDRLDALSYTLNGMSGFVLALFALILVNHFFTKKDKTISPTFMAFFCIAVAVCLSVLWESYEFVGDLIFDMDMQNYRGAEGNQALADTMTDLMACAVGATISAIMSAIIYRNKPNYLKSFSIEKVHNIEQKETKTKQQDEEIIETIE